jgi:uncharacterized membrane protein
MSHSFAPFAGGIEGIHTVPTSGANVAAVERIGSVFLGAVLASYGLAQRSTGGAALAALGGLLIYRGASGKCAAYRQLGIDTTGNSKGRGVPGNAGIRIERSIVVDRAPMELYYFWHDLSNLPRIMPEIKSIHVDEARSHWVVNGPAGREVSWDAEFITENPGEVIAWQSLPNSTVQNAGSVHFESGSERSSTTVKVALQYLPPAGHAGALVAHLFGAAPEKMLESALARFKETMETNS